MGLQKYPFRDNKQTCGGLYDPAVEIKNTNKKVKEKPQARKPDSVAQLSLNGCHLSGSRIAPELYRSTHPVGVSSEPLLSGRNRTGAYLTFQPARFTRQAVCTAQPWALTPRFHPYPFRRNGTRRLFSAALSVSGLHRNPSVRRCGALHCPDFPRFW